MLVPRRLSSERIRRLTMDFATPSCCAAPEKLPTSTARTKTVMSSKTLISTPSYKRSGKSKIAGRRTYNPASDRTLFGHAATPVCQQNIPEDWIEGRRSEVDD